MRATTGRVSLSKTGRARMLFSVNVGELIQHLLAQHDGVLVRSSFVVDSRSCFRSSSFSGGALVLTRNASLAESSIDILPWRSPLKSHFQKLLEDPQRVGLSSTRSRAARHAAVGHELP